MSIVKENYSTVLEIVLKNGYIVENSGWKIYLGKFKGPKYTIVNTIDPIIVNEGAIEGVLAKSPRKIALLDMFEENTSLLTKIKL